MDLIITKHILSQLAVVSNFHNKNDVFLYVINAKDSVGLNVGKKFNFAKIFNQVYVNKLA